MGILLGGRVWPSCCPFLLSQLRVSREQGPQRPEGASVYPCRLLLAGALAYLPRTPAPLSSPGQDGLPGASHTALSETYAETHVC